MTTMDVMDGLPHLLSALWTTSWQAGVVAGGVWLACRQWPRMPTNLRVMLWWLVSLKFVIGLVWTQPIPLPVLPASIVPADNVSTARIAGAAVVVPVEDERVDRVEAGAALPFVGDSGTRRMGSANVAVGLVAAAVALWLLGVVVQGALLLHQLVRTRRLIGRSQPVEGDAAELFDDLVTRLEVGASQPRLRVSTAIGTPLVTGLTRPVILLPVGALESFSTRELSLTLCHELMHVKRFDLWHGWIPSVAARLFFFHPLARLAAREYVIAREAACDARVLAFMGAPAYDYGRLLMRLGITAREAAPAAAGASPTLHMLKRRLLMLHDAPPHARGLSPRWWALAAIAALLVIPVRPTAAQPPLPSPQQNSQGPQGPRNPQSPQSPQSPQNPQNPQKPQNPENRHADSRNDDDAEPWVFVPDDDNAVLHGNAFDLAYVKRLRNGSEPLIWFKHEGRGYLIRDTRTIGNAQALFIQQEEAQKAMIGLEERQTILRAQQSDLERIQDSLRDQMRAIDLKARDMTEILLKTADRQKYRTEEARRQAAEEASHLEAESSRRALAAHQEATLAQQHALRQQQVALGEEQTALRRKVQDMHGSMEQEMRNLFDAARAAGVAIPVK